MMVDRVASLTQSPMPAEERAGDVGRHAGLTEDSPNFQARQAPAARGCEHQHDRIADREAVDVRPDATTSPAASWPSTIGTGHRRSPLIAERSE